MVMDLGVKLDSELPFGQHVKIQAQKANTFFGMLRSQTRLMTTLVQSHCSPGSRALQCCLAA